MNASQTPEAPVNMQIEPRLTRLAARKLEAQKAKGLKRDSPERDAETDPTGTAKCAKGAPSVGLPVLTITGNNVGSLPEGVFGKKPQKEGGNARTVTGEDPAALSRGVPGQRQASGSALPPASEGGGDPRVSAPREGTLQLIIAPAAVSSGVLVQRQASGSSLPPASEAGGEPRVSAPRKETLQGRTAPAALSSDVSGQRQASGSSLPPASEGGGEPRVGPSREETMQQGTATSARNPAVSSFTALSSVEHSCIFKVAQPGNYSLSRFREVTQADAAEPCSPTPGGSPPAWVVGGGGPTSPYNQVRRAPGVVPPAYAAVHGGGNARASLREGSLASLPEGGGDARQLARPPPDGALGPPRNERQPPQNPPNGGVEVTGVHPPPPAAQPPSRVDVRGPPPLAESGPARAAGRPAQPLSRVGVGGPPPLAQSGPGGHAALSRPVQPVTRAGVSGQPGPATALGPTDVTLQFVRVFVDDPTVTMTVRFRAGATVREVRKAEKSRLGELQTQKIRPDCLMLRTCIDRTVKVLEDFQAGREATLAEYGLLPREAPYNVYVFITAPPPNARQEQAAAAAVERSVGPGRPLPPGRQSSISTTHRTAAVAQPHPAPAPAAGNPPHPTAVLVPQTGQAPPPPAATATAAHLPQHGAAAAPPAAVPGSGRASAAADPAAAPGALAGSGRAAAAPAPTAASPGGAVPGGAAGRVGPLPLQAAQRQDSGGDARRLSFGDATDPQVQRPLGRHTESHPKRFTSEETEAFIRGVEALGIGYWKEILARGGFQPGRTAMNLKDKWVNIKKVAENPGIKQRGPSQLTREQIDRIIRCLNL